MQSATEHGRPKWLITVPLIFLALALLTATLPFTLLLTLVISLHPSYRGAPRAMLFLYSYVLCEFAGIVTCGWIWLRYRNDDIAFQAANFKLQCWWASSLMSAAKVIFSLRFHTHNELALEGPACIMLPRHASIADTVLPMTYYVIPQNIPLRYVLKNELQWDPCLEIVGNRLPNYFINRASQNSSAEVAGVTELLRSAPSTEGLLLYPEGTRYTKLKHTQLLEKSEAGSDLHAQLLRWPSLLPPRLGGCLGLLAANREHDLLFFAHSGFDGSANFVELMNGSWTHSQVHLEFWRVPYASIPSDPAEHQAFLFEQWDRMQQTVLRLDALRTKPAA